MEIDNKIIDFLDEYINNKYSSTNEAVDAIKEVFKQEQNQQLLQTDVIEPFYCIDNLKSNRAVKKCDNQCTGCWKIQKQ